MEVHPTPGQEAFIRQAIESGRIHRPEDAVEEALSLWEENERRKQQGTFQQPVQPREKTLSELFAPLRGVDVDFSRNPSTGRPVDL